MRITKLLLVCVFTILSAMTLQTSSHADPRFGPWVYFAPYYFPPDGCCLGQCFGPADFLPRYEAPNPPIPSHDVGACLQCPRPASYPTKGVPRQHVSRPAASRAIAPMPSKAVVPAPSRAIAPAVQPKNRTGVPASITSPPPDKNQPPSNGGALQQPQAINHPGPQTTDAAAQTVKRPLKWGKDRTR